ncbi:glycosyltransferase [Nitrincola iocasae]|uniref:Glycosyltransferase n=1 Tax=Nitrincola iocasae TaxID=2614693 RepID=A0A5J6LCH7_9GAMM|nr:glycosyltransferase family 2 protein [Nitrincola iocasae]QEW06243.1 glycosyltransferase [Nitrincola iocasae]
MLSNAGCVIIGRNEGERLERCLESVCKAFAQVVYVDSGSTDQSVQKAEASGAQVVNLDMDQPFTAARARNAGLTLLYQTQPDLEYVQFIDGDCELVASWPNAAAAYLDANPGVAVVCGRRRERFPDASVYNRLCDIEWNTPVGEATACGGDALMRIKALHEVNAYNVNLIAGEEPEMCHRLRMQGWKIFRLDEEMTLHDAAITRFSQWWKRGARGGYAYFRVFWLHRNSSVQIWKKNVLRTLVWAGLLPMLILLGIFTSQNWLLLLLLLYPILFLKVYLRNPQLEKQLRPKFALYMLLIKFAEFQGMSRAVWELITHKQIRLMEYK